MKAINILIIAQVAFFNILFVSADNNYFKTQFLKDKKKLEREAYSELKKNKIFKEQDSCKIKFIYIFDLPDLANFELISNNKYLSSIKPVYCFRRYLMFRKIQIKKSICAEGYIFNKRNILIAKIFSARGYPFKIDTFISSNYYSARVKVFENKEIDLFFYCGYFNSKNIIWCLKKNQTIIYNIDEANYIPLK